MEHQNRSNGTIEIEHLVEQLGSKKGTERMKARKKFVEYGDNAADYMIELLNHKNHIYRKEALKILVEIGNPAYIPFFLQALEDEESDIRWIAAKGLIKLGKSSLKPLLNLLVEKSDSIFVLAGAHHVFFDLRKQKKLPLDFPVNNLLEKLKTPEWKEGLKSLSYEILQNME